MNPFRCSGRSSKPKGKMMLVQQLIQIHPGGREEILDSWIHKNIPQDLTCSDVTTSVHLEDGTFLTTSEEQMEREISRYLSLISKLFWWTIHL